MDSRQSSSFILEINGNNHTHHAIFVTNCKIFASKAELILCKTASITWKLTRQPNCHTVSTLTVIPGLLFIRCYMFDLWSTTVDQATVDPSAAVIITLIMIHKLYYVPISGCFARMDQFTRVVQPPRLHCKNRTD